MPLYCLWGSMQQSQTSHGVCAWIWRSLYYQCMEVWIHFVWHSIHLLTHMGPETFQIGLLLCYTQLTLETAIGNLSWEICQDHDQFANLTQWAVIWMQVNSLCTQYPQIRFEVGRNAGAPHSMCSHNFKGGFVFLPWCEEFPLPLAIDKLAALKNYWWEQGWPNVDLWPNVVCRWVKLHLPNRQTAWSVWYESSINMKLQWASCIEVSSVMIIQKLWFWHAYHRSSKEVAHALLMCSSTSISTLVMFDTPLWWCHCICYQSPRSSQI